MKGDKKIIDILNKLLAGELTAVDQYLIHGETYADLGFSRLAEKSLHESDHERQHARAIIQRILFLEGTPHLDKRDKLNLGKTVPDMLKADLGLEYHVVGELKKAIADCEIAQDYVTRDMLCVQLDDTEVDHAYWLEQQIRLIKQVGLQNYQQSQMSAGDKARRVIKKLSRHSTRFSKMNSRPSTSIFFTLVCCVIGVWKNSTITRINNRFA